MPFTSFSMNFRYFLLQSYDLVPKLFLCLWPLFNLNLKIVGCLQSPVSPSYIPKFDWCFWQKLQLHPSQQRNSPSSGTSHLPHEESIQIHFIVITIQPHLHDGNILTFRLIPSRFSHDICNERISDFPINSPLARISIFCFVLQYPQTCLPPKFLKMASSNFKPEWGSQLGNMYVSEL